MIPKTLDEMKEPVMSPQQRERWEQEISANEKQLKRITSGDPTATIANVAGLRRQVQQQKALLEKQSPKPLMPDEKDKLAKVNAQLLADVKIGMISHADQRRGLPWVAAHQEAWYKANKRKILAWKMNQRRLDPDNPHASNLELHRPAGQLTRLDTDALIPGLWSLSPEGKAKYDEIDWDDHGQGRSELEAAGVEVKEGVRRGLRPKNIEAEVVQDNEDVLELKIHR